MTWTSYVPIIFSLAAVVFTYFGLYLRAIDKVDDLRKELAKQRNEDIETINMSLKALREAVQELTIVQAKAETKHDILCTEHIKQLAAVPVLDTKVSKMEAQLSVYFKTIDPFLAAAIHSPIHVERDALMERLEENTLTYEHAKQLEVELEKAIQEELDGNKKWIEILSLARVRSIIVGYEFDRSHPQIGG
jgi:hypothetical protein